MSCTEEEKIQWFKDTIGPTIAKITLTGDRVEEIIVADDLFDIAATALLEMPLPADFPDQANIPREQVQTDFADYCRQIKVRTATIEQLAIPDDTIAPEHLFIRPITAKMKVQGFVEQWDRSLGFTETLRGMGCPFDFSLEEKKMLFGFAHLMNCISMSAARQMPDAPVEMFKE